MITETNSSDQAKETKVEPFPLKCLPPVLRQMAEAICATERTPESLAGSCVLGVSSGSIGAGLQVKSGPSRVTRGNLYIVASGESGSGKSQSYRHAVQPFVDYEDKLVRHWEETELPGLIAEKEMLEAEIGKLKKGQIIRGVDRDITVDELKTKRKALLEIEAQLQAPIFSVEDITSEALAIRLAKRNEVLASFSADAGEVINNLLGRYNKLDRTDDGLYVKAWTGDSFRQDRATRAPIHLKRPCLSSLWLTQRDKIETLLAERSLTEGGAIPRLLLCHTNAEPRHILETTVPIPKGVWNAYYQLIWELLEIYRLAGEPITIEAAPDATALLNVHYNAIVTRWHRGEIRDVTSYALRWTEQAWRISVCLHAGANGEHAGERILSRETAESAIRIADWYSRQQLEILAGGRQAATQQIREKILEMLVDQPSGVSVRDVQRALHLPSADEAQFRLEEMVKEAILVCDKSVTGGRPRTLYRKSRK